MNPTLVKILGDSKALGAVQQLIDALFPFLVGQRTKIATILCPLLPYVAPLVPAPYNLAIPAVQTILCGSAFAFAAAGVIRDAQAASAAQKAAVVAAKPAPAAVVLHPPGTVVPTA